MCKKQCMKLPALLKTELPPHVNATLVSRLAREVVMEIRPITRILLEFHLSTEDYAAIRKLPYYKRVVEEFSAEWHRITSTQERLRLISAVLLEEGMPRLGSHMLDTNVSPAVAVETGKFFAKMAGVGEGPKQETTPGEKFTITINLGEDTKLQFTKDVTPPAQVEEEKTEPVLVETEKEGT